MTVLRAILVLLLSAASSSMALAQETVQTDTGPTQTIAALRELHWIRGPQTVPLFDVASIDVPQGFVFLNPEDTKRFNTLSQNPSSGTEYMLAPDSLGWVSFFTFSEDGYVKDDEKIDAAALLDAIRKGTQEGNRLRREKGWDELTIIGWKLPPFYDRETKHLEWAVNITDSSNESGINYNTRILGRRGVTSAVLVVDSAHLDAAVSEFNSSLKTYQYTATERYSAFRQGDKIAEYGLAALITGGLAAVATKTGFWKTIGVTLLAAWKFVAAALAGLAAYVRKLFTRRDETA